MYHFLSENYTCLPVRGGVYSADSFSDIPAYVLSRLNLTAVKPSLQGSATASYHRSPSGTTPEPSTAALGVDSSTLCPAASLAKESVSPEKVKGSTTRKVACGVIKQESLATYDHQRSMWKTRQRSLFEEGCESLVTLPQWGMTVSGELYRLPTPSGLRELRVSITFGIESGFTVRVPTPTTQDAKNNASPSQKDRDALNVTVGGPLNPEWVEWLMGWPIGWTDLKPLAMDRWQQWLNCHGVLPTKKD